MEEVHAADDEEFAAFAACVRQGLSDALFMVDDEYREQESTSGTTATALLVTGCPQTAACVGDSKTELDTGSSLQPLTISHRVNDNAAEQKRLRAAGCTIASDSYGFHLKGPAADGEPGVGPLRVWTGGLCVSRSIGARLHPGC